MKLITVVNELTKVAISVYKIVQLHCLAYTRNGTLKHQAELGVVEAQVFLGAVYSKGIGVTKDNREALKWYLKAANQGNRSAQLIIGVRYTLGEGVIQNHVEAIRWFSEAANQNSALAHLALGLMYANGTGVPRNLNRARDLFNLAMYVSTEETEGKRSSEI